jgi:hypothetical protein
LYSIRLRYIGFVHGDLLVKNILMCRNPDYDTHPSDYYEYTYNNQKYYIPIRRYIPKIWDFEFSSSDKYPNNLIHDNHLGVKNDIFRFLISLFYDLKNIKSQPVIYNATDIQSSSFNNNRTANKTFTDFFKRINQKYEHIFQSFAFLQEPPGVFLESDPEFALRVPSLDGVIERIDRIGSIRNDNFDPKLIFPTKYPNLASFKSIIEKIQTTIKLINFDFDKILSNGYFSKLPFNSKTKIV